MICPIYVIYGHYNVNELYMNSQNERKNLKDRIFGDELNKWLLVGAFAVYLVLLIWLIGFKCNKSWLPEVGVDMRKLPFEQRVRYIPFYDVGGHKMQFTLDYFLNILVYIPFGIFLMFALKDKKWICILIIFASSLIFETSQYFTGFGGADISDLICNTVGGCLGVLIYSLLRHKIKDKVVNIIAFCVCVLGAPFALYGIVNTIINWQLYVIY